MTTREKSLAKQKLAVLIQEFGTLYDDGKLKGSSEATARTWIERFLNIFGWNSSDPAQVRQEYRIQGRAARKLKSAGTAHRRPDYCLISNGQRILFIDAKSIDQNIKENDSIAYQVRCYGWSEGFRLSYAFDFEELAVYDCRIMPKDSDDADVARIKYWHYTQYLDKFDELWDFFSKDAIDAGSIFRHPEDDRPHGVKTLDQDFEEKLSYWRKEIAKSILRYGKTRDVALLSAAAQRILDRIIFLRICEEIGLEDDGEFSLLEMGRHEDGFWPLFLEQHEKRYSKVYDGILFPTTGEEDPSGVDIHLRSWWLKGRIFKEITSSLYYPNPYRFDVVPIELLGGIYEKYLGKRLRVVGNEVTDEFKQEHQRSKGAVYTPSWVVKRIVEKTLDPISAERAPEELLALKILDPACGSASFLLGVYDYLEKKILDWFAIHPEDTSISNYLIETKDGRQIQPVIAKRIINECIYGVDIDPEAVEVARMSLALRYLERTAAHAEDPHLILKGIGLNIRQGNSLVGPDIIGLGLDAENMIKETMPFDWNSKRTGFGDVAAHGFDAVVGNPPYIEVKRYKDWMPSQYKYLKESGIYETTVQGKTDIAMPFMEKGLRLLKTGGRLGYIIQNRFFKTDYGAIVRSWLIRNKAVSEIEDFRDMQIFVGRTTYTAVMILQKNSPHLRYCTYDSIADARAQKPLVVCDLPWNVVDAEVWSFDQPDLLKIHKELAQRHGTIATHRELQISVGLQTLYGKIYQLEATEIKPRTIVGKNGDGEIATLERAALRPLCRNRGFYPFRAENADAWVIFPYDIKDGQAYEIEWSQIQARFPKTAGYLEERKKQLMKAVEVLKSPLRWHLYKYPKNLVSQTGAKVLFPMTIEDAMASVDHAGDVYQDNVNVNSISFHGATPAQLDAIAAVFNSTLFNALARLKAGLNESGWRKFNRQYAELVPFPKEIFIDKKVVSKLSALASKISKLQQNYLSAEGEGVTQAFRATLEAQWDKLDALVEEVYGLSSEQKKILEKYPRRINRIDLLTRQALAPDEEEE